MIRFRFFLVWACAINPVIGLSAGDEIFARQGDQVLTHAELDAAFAKVPQTARLPYIRDGEKVDRLVQSLLRNKQIAADAVENGYDEDAVMQLRLKLAREEELAEAWVQQVVEGMPEVDYSQLAYERYLASPENFQTPEAVDVSHILIRSDKRPAEEALELANRLHEELVANPRLFDDYVAEYSEDPAKTSNNGRYTGVVRGQMVEPFENKAFSMTEPGQLSEPVETPHGCHIIRLDRKHPPATRPFDEVKQNMVQLLIKEREETYRRNYLMRHASEPTQLTEGAVETMVKRYFGENLELAPGYYEQ